MAGTLSEWARHLKIMLWCIHVIFNPSIFCISLPTCMHCYIPHTHIYIYIYIYIYYYIYIYIYVVHAVQCHRAYNPRPDAPLNMSQHPAAFWAAWPLRLPPTAHFMRVRNVGMAIGSPPGSAGRPDENRMCRQSSKLVHDYAKDSPPSVASPTSGSSPMARSPRPPPPAARAFNAPAQWRSKAPLHQLLRQQFIDTEGSIPEDGHQTPKRVRASPRQVKCKVPTLPGGPRPDYASMLGAQKADLDLSQQTLKEYGKTLNNLLHEQVRVVRAVGWSRGQAFFNRAIALCGGHPAPWGWGWGVRGQKTVCVPAIGLKCPASLMNVIFPTRKISLMWGGGSAGAGRGPKAPPPPPRGH